MMRSDDDDVLCYSHANIYVYYLCRTEIREHSNPEGIRCNNNGERDNTAKHMKIHNRKPRRTKIDNTKKQIFNLFITIFQSLFNTLIILVNILIS